MKIDTKILSDKITPDMLKPKTPGSAGIDLMAADFINITDNNNGYCYVYPNQCIKIGSGIAIHINDPEYAAFILPRSGLGHRGLVLGNLIGLIDSDFSSEIMISLWNRSFDTIKINLFDRVAQLIILPVIHPEFNIVKEFSINKERGSFGSTGLK